MSFEWGNFSGWGGAFPRDTRPIPAKDEPRFLGENLNRARKGNLLILDGRERDNPAAYRRCGPGVFRITRIEGRPTGLVRYWGVPCDEECEERGDATEVPEEGFPG